MVWDFPIDFHCCLKNPIVFHYINYILRISPFHPSMPTVRDGPPLTLGSWVAGDTSEGTRNRPALPPAFHKKRKPWGADFTDQQLEIAGISGSKKTQNRGIFEVLTHLPTKAGGIKFSNHPFMIELGNLTGIVVLFLTSNRGDLNHESWGAHHHWRLSPYGSTIGGRGWNCSRSVCWYLDKDKVPRQGEDQASGHWVDPSCWKLWPFTKYLPFGDGL
jgi:hypothetical protein